MIRHITIRIGVVALLALFAASPVWAKVSADEAQRLKNDLTPFGAERAGNADGTIPAWEGGITAPPEGLGYKGRGTVHPDPFTADKVLFSITAENMDQYADELSAGYKAMLKRYPDTMRMDVYPTRRTAAAPEWVYESTFKNATKVESTEDGFGIIANGGKMGVPFPIPQRAEELMFNHLLRWWGTGVKGSLNSYRVRENGKLIRQDEWTILDAKPWYTDTFTDGGNQNALILNFTAPPRRNGEVYLIVDPINQSVSPRKAWQYMPGQRRVRRGPTIAYDTPIPGTAGMANWDQSNLFFGALDRYDWKLLGKKEMFVPYNNYAADLVSPEELLIQRHVNPDHLRWERHRVWVVEANVREGKRHAYAKRVFYVDEDTWSILNTDIYDGRGNLWRMQTTASKNFYELPGYALRMYWYYDLTRDDYLVAWMQSPNAPFITLDNVKDESYFNTELLRRMGRR